MSMVERVARAFAKSFYGHDNCWTEMIPDARAAIEAMRPASDFMLKAGATGLACCVRDNCTDPSHVYTDMLVAALAEPSGEEGV